MRGVVLTIEISGGEKAGDKSISMPPKTESNYVKQNQALVWIDGSDQ
jgi:hypothetical protein